MAKGEGSLQCRKKANIFIISSHTPGNLVAERFFDPLNYL